MEFFIKNFDKSIPNLTRLEINKESIEASSSLFDLLNTELSNQLNLDLNEFYLATTHGTKLKQASKISNGDTFIICPLVLGGKGGFGSLLRSFGKQITKSTNKDACRDLTGRRIKHVNHEKRLKDFLENQSEIKKKKELEKQEKLERRKKKREKLESTHHLFVDAKYDQQKLKIAQDLDEVMSKAIENDAVAKKKRKLDDKVENGESSSDGSDEKATTSKDSNSEGLAQAVANASKNVQVAKKKTTGTADKLKDWMGVGDLDVSSDDDDDEDEEPPKSKNSVYYSVYI